MLDLGPGASGVRRGVGTCPQGKQTFGKVGDVFSMIFNVNRRLMICLLCLQWILVPISNTNSESLVVHVAFPGEAFRRSPTGPLCIQSEGGECFGTRNLQPYEAG